MQLWKFEHKDISTWKYLDVRCSSHPTKFIKGVLNPHFKFKDRDILKSNSDDVMGSQEDYERILKLIKESKNE